MKITVHSPAASYRNYKANTVYFLLHGLTVFTDEAEGLIATNLPVEVNGIGEGDRVIMGPPSDYRFGTQ